MARRRVKKRTHASARPTQNGSKPAESIPKSLVIRINASEVGSSVSQLVKDMRLVMSPHTASRLKERRGNKLRDYVMMAGPLGVSHLLLFSKSESGNTNLRLCTTPRGPTLSFRVEKYSLCKDIQKAAKRPRGREDEDYINPPLLLMNNFQQAGKSQETDESIKNPIPKQLEDLATIVFRSLFPPITPQTTPLNSVKRVLLLDRVNPSNTTKAPASNGESQSEPPFVIQLRHYAITTRRTGVPRNIKRVISVKDNKSRRLPNLGKLEDVSEYLLDPSAAGYTSASDTEIETDAEVEVLATTARKVLDKKQRQNLPDRTQEAPNVEKRAVKLVELGPRMTLRLQKIEEGLTGGKVLWHERFSKTREEEKQMDAMWEKRRKEKEERKRIQKENVERKKKEKKANGETAEGDEDDEDEEMEDYDVEDDWEDGLDDDDEEGGAEDEEMDADDE